MKNVMILSGGTGTAWHISDVIKRYYAEKTNLIICDINPPQLVSTSVLADRYIQVPPIKSEGYYETMLSNIRRNHVDILVPLIDDDMFLFPSDSPELQAMNVLSTTAPKHVMEVLGDKSEMGEVLGDLGILTPRVIRDCTELHDDCMYFIKDAIGFGSRGAKQMRGSVIKKEIGLKGKVIQEMCSAPEITVDVVNTGINLHTICRERVEIKLGVSTKNKVYYDSSIQKKLEKVAKHFDLPRVCCVQFMKNNEGEWTLIDFNMRSGAGTAISAAVGFEAVRYAAACWLGEPQDEAWLNRPAKERYVVRTYQEIVTQ